MILKVHFVIIIKLSSTLDNPVRVDMPLTKHSTKQANKLVTIVDLNKYASGRGIKLPELISTMIKCYCRLHDIGDIIKL